MEDYRVFFEFDFNVVVKAGSYATAIARAKAKAKEMISRGEIDFEADGINKLGETPAGKKEK
jgi:hypothetical protein